MTIVEFFDKADINNIAGALTFKPHKIILVGEGNDEMFKSANDYRSLLNKKKIDTVVETEPVIPRNLNSIINALVKIVDTNSDCVFDLAGGDDLFLVAVGVIAERFKDKVQLHRIDARKNTVTDCDDSGNIIEELPISLSVEELISVYGGRVIYTQEVDDGTFKWDFSDEFISDIKKMWAIYKDNKNDWNTQINALDGMRNKFYRDGDLYLQADNESAERYLKSQKIPFVHYLFRPLASAGLINDFKYNCATGEFSFFFKNEQVKRCLTKAGQLLEIYTAYMARELKKYNESLFDDVATGVYIDWDGNLSGDKKTDVHNEIDVILMKGLVPVFISCKSGKVLVDELYKLSSVADRFGGPYVKKVLVCSDLAKYYNAPVIRARAEEMGIELIDNVKKLTLSEFSKKLYTLLGN